MHDPKKPDLAMNYSRTEGGLVVRLNGAPTEDGQVVGLFLQPAIKELESRGYDPNTLRFSIRRKK